jgi:hypothetical protein
MRGCPRVPNQIKVLGKEGWYRIYSSTYSHEEINTPKPEDSRRLA